MPDQSPTAGLLDAILNAGNLSEGRATVTPKTTEERIVTDSAGVSWSIDPQTNIGTRITPVAKSALRRPTTMTRQFPALEDPRRADLKAQLAAIAADPFKASMFVALLALGRDRQGSLNELARTHPQVTEAVRETIVGAYVDLMGNRHE